MIVKRHIAYALLSLLLVLSQQLGITHAISHLSDLSQRPQVAERDAVEQNFSASKNLALDQNCDQCLAFAHIANALDTPSYTFPVVEHSAPFVLVADTPLACKRTVCVFHSRAPPFFA
ncbi:hypothetical protein GCM10027277_06110 [Pseudoduganella ginsengisoli]|uniref:DUF2946 domain-containing protein n=1 Tax=Pseudoduganella ginsengisoli TaxID=1462440 RepID=A0A6L6Q3Q5_9BURK|nr:hypothetical protein [Pseudoduganella ginsengisoli]MTW04310.1 hypothetical protein [Pseudoduganella ginsengisoli]